METNALDFSLGVVLSHLGDVENFHPIALYLKTISTAKINYEIHHK